MNKSLIRTRIRAQKSLLSEVERLQKANAVFRLIENTAAFMLSDKILMYHSLPDEVDTHAFLDKWNERKKFFLPRVNGVNLEILPYDKSRLQLGAFHIEEPDGDDVCDVKDIELIIVPAIAYDKFGNRVGRGKGFYDRLLCNTSALKIGVAYDFQIVEEIDSEGHDVKVDMIVTDTGVYKIK